MKNSRASQAISNFALTSTFVERSPREMFLLSLYYQIDIAGIALVRSSDIKDMYATIGVSVPSNFGGEIRSLRNQKYIGRNNLMLTKKGREYCKSMLSTSKSTDSGKLGKKGSKVFIIVDTLHPRVKAVSGDLYSDGHYAQAVFEAYKAVVNHVKSISGITNLDGKPLMEKVFSLNSPIIKLNPMVTLSDRDEQQGFMFLFSGAALGIRNPKAHDNIITRDEKRTLEYLTLASLLMSRLDERVL